jgi:hypothetical protein
MRKNVLDIGMVTYYTSLVSKFDSYATIAARDATPCDGMCVGLPRVTVIVSALVLFCRIIDAHILVSRFDTAHLYKLLVTACLQANTALLLAHVL